MPIYPSVPSRYVSMLCLHACCIVIYPYVPLSFVPVSLSTCRYLYLDKWMIEMIERGCICILVMKELREEDGFRHVLDHSAVIELRS